MCFRVGGGGLEIPNKVYMVHSNNFNEGLNSHLRQSELYALRSHRNSGRENCYYLLVEFFHQSAKFIYVFRQRCVKSMKE